MQATSRPGYLLPEIWSKMSNAAQRIEKQEMAKLDNARRLRGIYFIDLGDIGFKETIKNVGKKLEVPMVAAMASKVRKTICKQTCTGPDIRKSKYACAADANESTRKRLEGTQPKDHEDHIGEKVFNSLSHYNIVHKFIPIPDAKAAVDK